MFHSELTDLKTYNSFYIKLLKEALKDKYNNLNECNITNLKPLEHEELFVTEYRTIAESDNENIPSLRTPEKYVKVMVQGPAEIIDTLPDKYALNDEYEHLIYALIDATGLDKGTHTLPMEFHIMKLEDVEVITPSIKCQFEIVAKEDMPFPLEGY